jgi:hypothetical protein
MSQDFSRRSLFRGALGIGAGMLASRVPFAKSAFAESTAQKHALVVVFLEGGPSPFLFDTTNLNGVLGVAAGNTTDLGNGLKIDKGVADTLSAYAKTKVAAVGVDSKTAAHSVGRGIHFGYKTTQNPMLVLASAMGGNAAIKCARIGNIDFDKAMEPRTPVGGVALESIEDLQSLKSVLGGSGASGGADRLIAASALARSNVLSSSAFAKSPRSLARLSEGTGGAIETLKKPVVSFDYAQAAQAYGVNAATSSIAGLPAQLLAAEMLVRSGTNVVRVADPGWDNHPDKSGNGTRNEWNSRIKPALSTFLTRMLENPDVNVTVAVFGEFTREADSSHNNINGALVIGDRVKRGSTCRFTKDVKFATGAPGINGLWAYLATLVNTPPSTISALGGNPHAAITA